MKKEKLYFCQYCQISIMPYEYAVKRHLQSRGHREAVTEVRGKTDGEN